MPLAVDQFPYYGKMEENSKRFPGSGGRKIGSLKRGVGFP
jgi:hypothetical protein